MLRVSFSRKFLAREMWLLPNVRLESSRLPDDFHSEYRFAPSTPDWQKEVLFEIEKDDPLETAHFFFNLNRN